MSNEIAKIFNDENLIERFKSTSPPSMQFEAEKGFALQILKGNSYLMKVALGQPHSLAQAITNVAAIGLSLNPAQKEAYLIPRTVMVDKKYTSRVFLEPSYMGLMKLATNSGSIEWVQANAVYEEDNFIDHGPGLRPTHSYNAFNKDRGNLIGFYCVAKTSGGDFLTTLMTIEEIEGIRDRSESWKEYKAGKAKTGGPWQSDFNEQAKKTVIRRGFKTWPKTDQSRMAAAVDISNNNEGFEPIVSAPQTNQYTAEQKEYFDQLISKGDAVGMFAFRSSFDTNDASSESAGVWISLMHSFEKGTKGKYGEIVRNLTDQGRSLIEDMAATIEEHIQNDDSMAVIELAEDLNEDEKRLIDERLSIEASMEFNKITHKLKQAS